MNNETEHIFLSNSSNTQPLAIVPKINDVSASTPGLEDFSTVCRTCATVTEFVIPIFNGEGLQNNLADKIHKHLPIQVTEHDVLPRVVCYQCASTLLAWHELVQCCVQADAALRARLAVAAANTATAAAAAANTTTAADTTESILIGEEVNEKSTRDEPHKSETNFIDMIKRVLVEYSPTVSTDSEELDLDCVCHKCPATMTSTPELVEHFIKIHSSDITNYETLQQFIKEHITFEEALNMEDSDSDDGSEANVVSRPQQKTIDALRNFFCPFCKNIFSSSTRLICHLNRHIEVSIDEGVQCCEKTYSNKKTFVQHLQEQHVNRVLDESKDICRSCGFEAEDACELQTHVNTVHDYRKSGKRKNIEGSAKNQRYIPAVCPECNKTFSNKYNMFVHMKSHNGGGGEKYPCDRCDKSYSNPGNLKYHKRVTHEGIMNFPCTFCGEAFPGRLARDTHMRIHSGDTPYSCRECHKSFRAKNSLDRHLDAHLDIRKYRCSVCPNRFRKRSHLNYHLGTHESKK